jgi:hypothetical protein
VESDYVAHRRLGIIEWQGAEEERPRDIRVLVEHHVAEDCTALWADDFSRLLQCPRSSSWIPRRRGQTTAAWKMKQKK